MSPVFKSYVQNCLGNEINHHKDDLYSIKKRGGKEYIVNRIYWSVFGRSSNYSQKLCAGGLLCRGNCTECIF